MFGFVYNGIKNAAKIMFYAAIVLVICKILFT